MFLSFGFTFIRPTFRNGNSVRNENEYMYTTLARECKFDISNLYPLQCFFLNDGWELTNVSALVNITDCWSSVICMVTFMYPETKR